MSPRTNSSPPPIAPFVGIIESTYDALICFEAARRALIPRITRRLLETEKAGLIQSGAVFIFDEEESGIKRWTDGLIWSPSRILSNFLVYRETSARTDRHHPNVVSRAKTSTRSPSESSTDDASKSEGGRSPLPPVAPRRRVKGGGWTGAVDGASEQERERELVGSLTSTYKFKTEGLIKKTISVTINGVHQHLVSYYSMEDAMSGRLRPPSSFPELSGLEISADFLTPTHFRFPPVPTVVDGITRYKESEESIPPRRASVVSTPTDSPKTKAPPLPRRRSKTFTHATEFKPTLASLSLGRTATVTVQGDGEDQDDRSSVASSSSSSREKRHQPDDRHVHQPQPRSREQISPPSLYSNSNSSYSTDSPAHSPDAWANYGLLPPSHQVYVESSSSGPYGGVVHEQDGFGNDNGKRDRGPWYPSDQQQQFQPPRPCYLSQASTDSFSHLGYSLPSPSETPAILYHHVGNAYAPHPSLRPISTNHRMMDPSSYTPSSSDYSSSVSPNDPSSGSGSSSSDLSSASSSHSPAYPTYSSSYPSASGFHFYQPSPSPSSFNRPELDHWASSSSMSTIHGGNGNVQQYTVGDNLQQELATFDPQHDQNLLHLDGVAGSQQEQQHQQAWQEHQQMVYHQQMASGMVAAAVQGKEQSGIWYGWGEA